MKTKRSLYTTVLTGALALTLIVVGLLGAAPAYAQTSVDGLTLEEVEGLQFMLEEEKLARDVYLTLEEQWGLNVFRNISRAEQTHMNAVVTVLERYGIEASLADGELGVFVDEDLQTLYDQLVDAGSGSMADALLVGVAIEEIDILDLQKRLDATKNADIQRVYANLLRGSGNHLRAFVSNLERQTGETVEPQHLTGEAFDEIMADSGGRNGNGRGGSRRGNQGNQGRRR